jgi:hypothetical protein
LLLMEGLDENLGSTTERSEGRGRTAACGSEA